MIEEGDENDESGEGPQPIDETAEQEMLMLRKTPTAIEVISQSRTSSSNFATARLSMPKAAKNRQLISVHSS